MCCCNIMSLMWESTDTYISLLEKFGMPDIFDLEKGGGAIWNITPHKIMLFDKPLFPEEKSNIYVTTPIKLFANANASIVKVLDHGKQKRIAEIISILPKYVSYDPVSETVTTCFYNVDLAFYLTMLCMKITTGELNSNDARNILVDSLGSPINNLEISNYIKEYIATF